MSTITWFTLGPTNFKTKYFNLSLTNFKNQNTFIQYLP